MRRAHLIVPCANASAGTIPAHAGEHERRADAFISER
jgi:hypothetical protein